MVQRNRRLPRAGERRQRRLRHASEGRAAHVARWRAESGACGALASGACRGLASGGHRRHAEMTGRTMSGASAAGRQCRGAAPGGLTASWSGACSGPTEFCSGAWRLRRRQADSVLRAAHLRQASAQRKRRLRRADGMRRAQRPRRGCQPASGSELDLWTVVHQAWRLCVASRAVQDHVPWPNVCLSLCALWASIDFRLNFV